MKHAFFFSFLILSLHCHGQKYTDYDEETRNAYEQSGWFFSERDSAFVEFEDYSLLKSPDSNYAVLIRTVGLSDVVGKFQYWLINKRKNDTTYLGVTFQHDEAGPHFYWVLNNTYLLYEQREYSNGRLFLRNLQTNQVELDTPGTTPLIEQYSKDCYDSLNEIFFFFNLNADQSAHSIHLMEIDLQAKQLKKLMAFEPPPFIEFPIVSVNPVSRTLKLKYFAATVSDWEFKEVELKY